MGSLRKMFRSRLPSLASLWSDGGGGASSNPDDAERPAGGDELYSCVQKRESTYEMMRECPEIIEEVVEMRYNTGTIVKPHLRHGLRRPSAQAVFDIPLEDEAEPRGAASDSGLSSKSSDSGDAYAVPKSDTYDVPKSETYVVPRAAVRGAQEEAMDEAAPTGAPAPEESENGQLGRGEESAEEQQAEDLETDGSEDYLNENLYLEPKTVEEIERDRQKTKYKHLMSEPRVSMDAESAFTEMEFQASRGVENASAESENVKPQTAPKVTGLESYADRSSTMLHKARSLQNLQQCFIEVQTAEPKMKSKKSFRLHPKAKPLNRELGSASRDERNPVGFLEQSINDNFVLRPSERFRAGQRALLASPAGGGGPVRPWGPTEEVNLALDEALAASSRGSTLERGYERVPFRSLSADGGAPQEPLYANSHELRQLLAEELRRSAAADAEAAPNGGPAEQTGLPPAKVRGRGARGTGGPTAAADDDDIDYEQQRQLEQAEAIVALRTRDSKFACVRVKRTSRGRTTMRKSCSMNDLGVSLSSVGGGAPPAAGSRLQEAHRSVQDHCEQAGRLSRPASAAASGYLSVWLAVSAVWGAVCGWVGAAGAAVGGALGRAASPLVDWVGIKYMGVHRNHPWLPDLVCQPDLDYWVRRTKKGSNGFEELRKYIKHGGDFCKELASILQERSDLEVSYAKSLQKLAAKLLKSSKEGLGTVNQAWQMVGAEMEHEADVHKTLALAYAEDLVKPLKGLLDTQHKVRKSVEGMVDKTAKSLAEWRSAEAKAKKVSYQCARENERAEEQALEARLGRGKQVTDKETSKVESRRQKTENAMGKADADYYNFCLRGERARLEWETAVNKGSRCFQALEEERLLRLQTALRVYHENMAALGPKMAQSAERLAEPVSCADVSRDVQTVINVKGVGQSATEQLLPDFYAEDMTNAMNRERRKKALEQFLQLIRQDISRERRGKSGVENLAKAMQEAPQFGNEGSQKDVHEKLKHMRSMLAYLEASRYKIQSSLAELDGQPRPQHPLSKHIEHHKDRQGMTQSILKVPSWVQLDPSDLSPDDSPDMTDGRGRADGNSNQHDSDFDEFSSEGDQSPPAQPVTASPAPADSSSDQMTSSPSPVEPAPSLGRCKALYDYKANMYDELTIKTGDVINIHDKQDDGWWLGDLDGTVGIFPATYVQEFT